MLAAKTRPELGTSKRWMKPQPCLKSCRIGSRPPGGCDQDICIIAIPKKWHFMKWHHNMRQMMIYHILYHNIVPNTIVPASYCHFKVLQLMIHLLALHEIALVSVFASTSMLHNCCRIRFKKSDLRKVKTLYNLLMHLYYIFYISTYSVHSNYIS